MNDLPEMLKQGDRARLFPVLADTSREGRMTSIFLALLPTIPPLAETILSTTGQRIGKRTQIDTYTEIVLNDASEIKNRPDGLIVLSTGKGTWTALVEAKIGKSELDAEQVTRYLEAAKSNRIDAVITISNQFVARADLSPLTLPKTVLKKAQLFHWSWTWIQTQCDIIAHQQKVEDLEQVFLLREFRRLLKHSTTGIERFTQMAPNWKDVVQAVSNQDTLKRNSPEVEQTVQAWFQELRDLSLMLSSHVGQSAVVKIERSLIGDSVARQRDGCATLAENNKLQGVFAIPSTASDIEVCADLMHRSVVFSMKLKAPQDKKSTKARVNWLLRMLKDDDPRLAVRAHWPGRKAPTQKDLAALRIDPDAIDDDRSDTAPHSFEVMLIEVDAKRFAGRRTFIELLETSAILFYDLVGQNLRSWQAPPPKPIRPSTSDDIEENLEHNAPTDDTV